MEIQLCTCAEAARVLGVSRQAVNSALKRGSLAIAKNPTGAYLFQRGRPLIELPEVERYGAARHLNKGGRPRRKAIA